MQIRTSDVSYILVAVKFRCKGYSCTTLRIEYFYRKLKIKKKLNISFSYLIYYIQKHVY